MIRTVSTLLLLVGFGLTAFALATAGEAFGDSGSALVDAGAIVAPPPDSAALPPPPVLPDPTTSPVDAASAVTKLWRSGAITSALIVAAFFLLVVLRQKIAWLREGYRAVIVAAVIGGLGFIAEAVAGGASPNASMVIIALTTALALALQPKPAAA